MQNIKMDQPPAYDYINDEYVPTVAHGPEPKNEKSSLKELTNYAIRLGALFAYFRYGTGYLEFVFPLFTPELYLIYTAAVRL